MKTSAPLVTVAVPSLNQGRYLDAALESIFSQDVAAEVAVADGGSTDETAEVIKKWQSRLVWWRIAPDNGQAAAINEALRRGRAPYVCWLNADDTFLPGGLQRLVDVLASTPRAPAVYGDALITNDAGVALRRYRTEPFSEPRFARRCFISQPATLIRRSIWEAVGGLDESLHLALDYDLWWKIFRHAGEPHYVRATVATSRSHAMTKTMRRPLMQWLESMLVVRRHYGRLPLRWYIGWPYSVGARFARRFANVW